MSSMGVIQCGNLLAFPTVCQVHWLRILVCLGSKRGKWCLKTERLLSAQDVELPVPPENHCITVDAVPYMPLAIKPDAGIGATPLFSLAARTNGKCQRFLDQSKLK